MGTEDPRLAEGSSDALELLRPLARRAVGMSGADIERIVREARQAARRQKRPLQWADIEERLSSFRVPLSADSLWRLAVHEAGHVVVRLAQGEDGIELITVEAPDGGLVRVRDAIEDAQDEAACMQRLSFLLAGRAAELHVLGSADCGSGGVAESDLARATSLAVALETAFGYGGRHPLLYRGEVERASLLSLDRSLADRVHARLEQAEQAARTIVVDHEAALRFVAGELTKVPTLEGADLRRVLDRARAMIRPPVATRSRHCEGEGAFDCD